MSTDHEALRHARESKKYAAPKMCQYLLYYMYTGRGGHFMY